MQNITQWIWSVGSALLVVLMARAAYCRIYKRYPLFFSYICTVVLNTAIAALLFGHPLAYVRFYWAWSQPSSIVTFTLVLWEAQRRTFKQAPGFANVLRFLLPAALGWLAMRVALAAWSGSFRILVDAMSAFERSSRELQAGYLAVVLLFVLYYRIPVHPNVKAILWGGSLITAAGLFCLGAVAFLGPDFYSQWAIIQPAAFCFAVGLWIIKLWRKDAQPAAEPERIAGLEHYREVHLRTSVAYTKLFHRLSDMLRS